MSDYGLRSRWPILSKRVAKFSYHLPADAFPIDAVDDRGNSREVLDIPRCQRRASASCDGGDLIVELRDWPP